MKKNTSVFIEHILEFFEQIEDYNVFGRVMILRYKKTGVCRVTGYDLRPDTIYDLPLYVGSTPSSGMLIK
jgi:hypothetical protein